MRRFLTRPAAIALPLAGLLLAACVDTTYQQGGSSPYGSAQPYGRTPGSGSYGPGYGQPYGYGEPQRERNRDHSRYFFPENNVRCDRATSVCEKWRGREQGFQPDPSETKDYFGKGARRDLMRDLEDSPPPPGKPPGHSRGQPEPRRLPPAPPPAPPPGPAPQSRVLPPPQPSPPAVVRPAPVVLPAPQQQKAPPRASGEEWLKKQATQ